MKHYEPTAEGRDVSDEEANAIDALSEDFPEEPPSTKNLPDLEKISGVEEDDGGNGMKKAMDILDEYEHNLPRHGKEKED